MSRVLTTTSEAPNDAQAIGRGRIILVAYAPMAGAEPHRAGLSKSLKYHRNTHGLRCIDFSELSDSEFGLVRDYVRQIVRARFRTKEKAHHKSLPKEIEATPPRQGNDKIPMETGILTGVDVLERSAQGNDKIPEMQGNFNGVALPGRSDQESDIPPEDQGDLSRLAKRGARGLLPEDQAKTSRDLAFRGAEQSSPSQGSTHRLVESESQLSNAFQNLTLLNVL